MEGEERWGIWGWGDNKGGGKRTQDTTAPILDLFVGDVSRWCFGFDIGVG